MTEDPTVEQKIKEIFADEPAPEPAPAPEAAVPTAAKVNPISMAAGRARSAQGEITSPSTAITMMKPNA